MRQLHILYYLQLIYLPPMQGLTQYETIVGTRSLKAKIETHSLHIFMEELEGSASASGHFSADTIGELSAGLMESPEEMLRLIESCSKSELISLTPQGNLLIKFRYDIAGKAKTKDIQLVLNQTQLEGVQALKIQNNKLKTKTAKLESEVAELKGKCEVFEKEIKDLKSGLQSLQGSTSSLSSSIYTLSSQLGAIQTKWPLVDSFFMGGYKYKLNQYWELEVCSNAIYFMWRHQNHQRKIDGIRMSETHKNKEIVLRDY